MFQWRFTEPSLATATPEFLHYLWFALASNFGRRYLGVFETNPEKVIIFTVLIMGNVHFMCYR